MQGHRYWGVWGVSHPPPPQNFKKSGEFGQNKGKFGQNNGKFCHKWQHLWLLVHPIKFGQFYKNSIFGRFNEHTPPIKVVSRRPWSHVIIGGIVKRGRCKKHVGGLGHALQGIFWFSNAINLWYMYMYFPYFA